MKLNTIKLIIKSFLPTLIGLAILGYGWVLNLLALTSMEPFVWTAKSVIGIGGVFIPPIGTIMGYFVW